MYIPYPTVNSELLTIIWITQYISTEYVLTYQQRHLQYPTLVSNLLVGLQLAYNPPTIHLFLTFAQQVLKIALFRHWIQSNRSTIGGRPGSGRAEASSAKLAPVIHSRGIEFRQNTVYVTTQYRFEWF